MHDALRVDELLAEIFSHLIPKWDYVCCGDLNAVVGTCKTFFDPGIEALWQGQHGLSNILKLLPADSWEEVREDLVPGSFTYMGLRILREVSEEEWQKALRYARLVRRLHVGVEDRLGLAGITKYYPIESGLLFPRLHKLSWRGGCQSFLDLRPFIGLSLVRLELLIRFAPKEKDMNEVRQLCSRLANLRHFDIFIKLEGEMYHTMMSLVTGHLHQLETLSAHILDRPTFERITRIPTVQEIAFTAVPSMGRGWDIPGSSLAAQTPASHTLQCLAFVFTGANFPLFTGMLETSTTWRLTTILVTSTGLETHQTIRRMYATVASRVQQSTLECLHLGDFENPRDGEEPPEDAPLDDYVVSAHTLSLLFCFPNLESVKLSSSAGFALDDATVRALASTWRSITELQLSSASDFTASPGLNLTGAALVEIARYCKQLKTLELPMRMTDIPNLDSIHDLDEIAQTALTHLELCEPPIRDPDEVAELLLLLFPKLRRVFTSMYWFSTYEEEYDEEDEECGWYYDWREVSRILWANTEETKEDECED
ncbi:hypothetical protein MKEN_00185000 [Mycena kentingensis (nom. inval.)]|nr:hypothetical protein MKEN_00185000 [Mycena kentingensis (nom. inval.)]